MPNPIAIELLNRKRCAFWPNCRCNETLADWQDALPNERLSIEALIWAETSIFLALSCVADRCLSRRHRVWAQANLLNPWWDLQRVGRSRVEQLTRGS